MHRRLWLAALSVIVGVLLVACADVSYTEFVINRADHPFVLHYEPPNFGDAIQEFTIPAASSGTTLGGVAPPWHGVVVVMTSDCLPLGRVEISANPTLLIIAADGTFSLITNHVDGRTDTNANTIFQETQHCPG
jgi:hypothetical protein